MSTLGLIGAKLRATTILSGGALRDLARRDQLWVLPLAAVGVAVGGGALLFTLVSNYRVLLAVGTQAGRPEVVLAFAVLASWAVALLLGVPVVVSVFFYSRDTAMLLALPIRPLSIVAANAVLVVLPTLALDLFVLVPAFVVYALAVPVGPSFVASAVVLLLASPLVPVALCILLGFGLTAVVNLSRYRTALEVAGFLAMLCALVAVQAYFQRTMMGEAMGASALPAALAQALLAIPSAFAPLDWASRAVLPGGLLPLAAFVLFSAAVAAAAGAVAATTFLRLTLERAVTRSRKVSERRSTSVRSPRSPVAALFVREAALIASSSSTLFEAVVEGLVFPLILVIFSFTLPQEAKELVGGFVRTPAAPLAVFGVLALMAGVNTVSSTSISREGRTLALSLTLPVDGRVQVRAKLLFHLAVFATGYLVDLALVFAVFRLPLLHLAWLLPAGAAYLVLSFCSSILVDLRRPYLTWTHPQQAMKQNMNALAAMGIALLAVVLHAVPAALVLAFGGGSLVAGATVAALLAAESAIALPALYRYADRRYGGELEAVAR